MQAGDKVLPLFISAAAVVANTEEAGGLEQLGARGDQGWCRPFRFCPLPEGLRLEDTVAQIRVATAAAALKGVAPSPPWPQRTNRVVPLFLDTEKGL